MYYFQAEHWTAFFFLTLTTSVLILSSYSFGFIYKNILFGKSDDDINLFSSFVCIGFVIIFILINLMNFFVKIPQPAFFYFLFAFAVLGIVRLLNKKRWWTLLLLFITCLTFAGINFANHVHPDFHLYHGKVISWILAEPVPIGLVNLDGRLGFNSFVDIIQSGITISEWTDRTFVSSAIWSSAIWVILMAHILELMNKHNRILFGTIFAAILVGITFHPLSYTTGGVDLATHVFALIGIALIFLNNAELGKKQKTILFHSSLCILVLVACGRSIFIVLAFIPLSYIIREKLLSNIREYFYFFTLPVIMGFVWIGRNIALTGCLSYPIEHTCFPSLSWTPDLSSVEHMRAIIRGFAREPGNSIGASEGWDWLPGYISRLFTNIPLQYFVPILLAILVWKFSLSFGQFSLSFGRLKTNKKILHIGSERMPLLLVTLFTLLLWFMGAPDPRIGWSLFVILTIVIAADYSLKKGVKETSEVAVIPVVSICIFFIFLAINNIQYRFYIRPQLVEKPVTLYKKQNGVQITQPEKGAFCGVRQIFCKVEKDVNVDTNGYRYFFTTVKK